MRISQNLFIGGLIDQINQQQNRYTETQERLSTHKKVNRPSDDPISAERIVQLNTLDHNFEQFRTTSKRSEAFLEHTEAAIDGSINLINQMRDLATQLSNESYCAEDRLEAAPKVDEVLDQMLQLANSNYDGIYIFGGTLDQTPPFDETNYNYLGNDGIKEVEIFTQERLTINLPGSDVFTDTNHGKEDIFQHLQDFKTALENNDTAGIMGSLTTFENSLKQLSKSRSIVGFSLQKITMTRSVLESKQQINTEHRVDIEDADIARELSNLTKIEQTLQANYALTGRTKNLTLLNYLLFFWV